MRLLAVPMSTMITPIVIVVAVTPTSVAPGVPQLLPPAACRPATDPTPVTAPRVAPRDVCPESAAPGPVAAAAPPAATAAAPAAAGLAAPDPPAAAAAGPAAPPSLDSASADPSPDDGALAQTT